ncbi:MAG: Bug family tripartite tricarboxylate transporter substrate binding protein [Ramlibacter sp.]
MKLDTTRKQPSSSRRLVLQAAAVACASFAALAPATSFAQAWPSKPIRLIVNFPPGSSPDVVARAIGVPLSQALGQPVVIDNRAGASGLIGAEAVAKSAPDGYTLLVSAGSSFTMVPHMMSKMSFDPLKDFVPVSGIGRIDIFMVTRADQPYQNFQDFIKHAKSNPGKMTYSSAGNGTSPHLAGEMLKSMAGIYTVHIPYRGTTPALQDLLAGTVNYSFDSGASVTHIKQGKLRLLATAGTKRSSQFPDTPTLHELGLKGFDAGTTHGLFAPAGTPKEVVDRLNAEVNKLLADPKVAQQIRMIGAEPALGSAADFKASMTADSERYAAVIKARGIRPD